MVRGGCRRITKLVVWEAPIIHWNNINKKWNTQTWIEKHYRVAWKVSCCDVSDI